MILRVSAKGVFEAGEHRFPCVLGKAGVTPTKREGDHATPAGSLPLRRVFYRPDRMAKPETALPVTPLAPAMGWCDDPAHPAYNTLVALPFDAGHEVLWRDDALYDLFCVLGHNDDPPVPGLGSAIFLHLTPESGGTEGCVALGAPDLRTVLAACGPGDRLAIMAP